ncbi:MAG: homocysteine S-methyltransferase family protein [Spirochaetales bacterium]|nr:homocysteine S-methyltransferase family protein [Spirochaetales bacterium]
MKILGKEWDEKTVLLADGAWGTELLKLGLETGDPPELWNIEHPDMVKGIALGYLNAGSTFILTNTFGGSRIRLERHGLGERAFELNKIGAQLTAEAVKGKAVVTGDIGPTGKMIVMGEVTEKELYDSFAEQAAALKEGGASWILIETMSDVDEMGIAVRASVETTNLPVIASMTYDPTPHGPRTMMGNTPEQCVKRAEQEGAYIIGANCGTGIENYIPVAREIRKLTSHPVWIKANAGIPELINGKAAYKMTAGKYAFYIPELLRIGVNVIGGCCGTTPEFIKKMKIVIDNFNRGIK